MTLELLVWLCCRIHGGWTLSGICQQGIGNGFQAAVVWRCNCSRRTERRRGLREEGASTADFRDDLAMMSETQIRGKNAKEHSFPRDSFPEFPWLQQSPIVIWLRFSDVPSDNRLEREKRKSIQRTFDVVTELGLMYPVQQKTLVLLLIFLLHCLQQFTYYSDATLNLKQKLQT